MSSGVESRSVATLHGVLRVERDEPLPRVMFVVAKDGDGEVDARNFVLLSALSPELQKAVRDEFREKSVTSRDMIDQLHPETQEELKMGRI